MHELLHLDYESASEVDLRVVGLSNYASDPTTFLWCAAFAFDDEPVELWYRGQQVPQKVVDYIGKGGLVVAHNYAFEMHMSGRQGWPRLAIEQGQCTMVMAYAAGLPGSLEKAAPALGIGKQKDMEGHRLMLQMSKPRGYIDGKAVWWDEAEKIKRLGQYCQTDVEVERALGKRLFSLSPSETALWQLDQRINGRGIHVDLDSIRSAISIVDSEKLLLDKRLQVLTENFVGTCSEVARLASWLTGELKEDVESVAKSDVYELLERTNLPAHVREALLIRQQAGKSSTSKLTAMRDKASPDGRVRGTMQFCGANTGRWAGRGIQPHNMPRGKFDESDVALLFSLLRSSDSRDSLGLLYGPPLVAISNLLRSFICASFGNELLWVDFAAIEARVLAWLAGEETALSDFRNGGDPYLRAASWIYGVPPAGILNSQRQVGKVADLACGYQGGVGAFQSMAKNYGVKVDDEEADRAKVAWRNNRPCTVDYWYKIERAVRAAIRSPGETITTGGAAPGRLIRYKVSGSFLFCQLPSARTLTYPYPNIERVKTKWGEKDNGITYMSEENGQWKKVITYGGSLVENLCQAVARDILAEGIFGLEAAGYPVVFHVHDEIVCERKIGEGCVEEMEKIVSRVPKWAGGLPLVAKGCEGKRYRK